MTTTSTEIYCKARNQLAEAARHLGVAVTLEDVRDGFCKKCGVSSEFHMNLYCRKMQGLQKGIQRLKQQLAEARKEASK